MKRTRSTAVNTAKESTTSHNPSPISKERLDEKRFFVFLRAFSLHFPPDLVVEVLSPSSAKKDRGYKKDLYEKTGVQEYWIVEPALRSIATYLLTDGKYRLNDIYALFTVKFPIR